MHKAVGGGRHQGTRMDCVRCHAAYMREWRKTHPLNAEQRLKDTARSFANVYKRRGKLHAKPCEKCGSLKVEMCAGSAANITSNTIERPFHVKSFSCSA